MAEQNFENPVYLIEFIYNSGARIRYWMTEFKIDGGKANWQCACVNQQPLHLNLDDIESIHQVDVREADDLRDPTDTRLSWER